MLTPEKSIKMEPMEERKKRHHDEENDRGARGEKRSRIMDDPINEDEDPEVQVKVMIPLAAAGAIIGKSGETLRKLMTDNKSTLKMSRGNDTYPGTAERICLVRGRASNVVEVIKFFVETIKSKVDPNQAKTDAYDYKNTERSKEVKLIIPNSSAGYVIGKSGQTIKEMKEKTGAFIQINPKAGSPEAQSTLERVVTIVGEINELGAALSQILPKVALDSSHGAHSTISYPEGPLLNPNAARGMAMRGPPPDLMSLQHPSQVPGPQFAMPPPLPPRNIPSYVQAPDHKQDMMGGLGNGSGLPVKFNPLENLGNVEVLSFLDNLQATLRASGFNESAVAEIMAAMQVLAKYNIMGLGLGLGVAAMAQMRSGETSSSVQQAQAAQMAAVKESEARVRAAQESAYRNSTLSDFDVHGLSSSSMAKESYLGGPDLSSRNDLSMAMDSLASSGGDRDRRRAMERDSQYQRSSSSSYLDSVGVGHDRYSPIRERDDPYAREYRSGPTDSGGLGGLIKERMQIDPKVLELEVSDRIIGAVLGVQGKNLQEINRFSGAHVEVSPRGTGRAPQGFRQVTITAGTQDAVRAAKVMVERSVNEEQARRFTN